MLRTPSIALILAGCIGGTPPTSPDAETPASGALPDPEKPASAYAGVRTLSAETVRKAFEPLEVRDGPDGLRCAVFLERVILTRPTARGTRDLRVRPRDVDLDTDCEWDGPVLVSTQVDGEVLGVVWPYIVAFAPGESDVGRLQIVQGITGGTVVEMIEVVDPSYVKSLTLGFGVPTALDVEREPDESCEAAYERTWAQALPGLRASGRIAPGIGDVAPTCPASAMERCELMVTLPYELMLGTSSPSPVSGTIGCIAAPPPRPQEAPAEPAGEPNPAGDGADGDGERAEAQPAGSPDSPAAASDPVDP